MVKSIAAVDRFFFNPCFLMKHFFFFFCVSLLLLQGHVAWNQKHFKPMPPPICTSGVPPSGPTGKPKLRKKAPPFPRSRSLGAGKNPKYKSMHAMHAPPPPRKPLAKTLTKSQSAGTIISTSPKHRPLYSQPSWIHEDEERNKEDRNAMKHSSNKKRRRCVIS